MDAQEPKDNAEIDSETLENLEFQQDLAVDAAGAFIQGLQTLAPATDPGLSAPLTHADAHTYPGESTGTGHSPSDAGLSSGIPHDPAAGMSHDPVLVAHDVPGVHDSGSPAHIDAGAFHH